ncbi:MAG: aminodeoxychorismate synthase component I [Cetobacterium sp.]
MLIKEFDLDDNPIEIFENFLSDDTPIFLDSQKNENDLGRYSIIVSNPFIKFSSKNGVITIFNNKDKTVKKLKGNSLKELSDLLEQYKIDYDGPLPFVGGAIGHFSYELLHEIEDINLEQVDDLEIPDINIGIFNEAIIIDNTLKKIYLVINEFLPYLAENISLIEMKIKKKKLDSKKDSYKEVEIENCVSKIEYIKCIEKIKDNIENGNVYQINYTQRFQCELNKPSFSLYKRLRETNKAPFASFLSFKGYEIVSNSPERFIRVQNGKIDTRPIKGTISRGKNQKEDEENFSILSKSIKDQSELLMIVDLERNDLGKICQTGTVQVKDLFFIERYSTVFQQVANVEGILKENITFFDIMKATFPGGSITGAPKISAMKLIGELEKTTRNIYTGSIGYISFNGNIDLNIVIRTILCKKNKAYFQVGGGIVWDSNAESEFEESLLKGKALKEALLWKGE